MRNRARLLVFCAAVASTLALAWTIAAARDAGVVTAALVFATSWAAVISAADAVMLWRAPPPNAIPASRPSAVTVVMSLGDERPDLARTSIVLAAQAGPLHVVATRHHEVLDQLGDVTVIEHLASTISQAVQEAARAITTEGMLLISASAFPVDVSCALAASALTDDVAWVVGSTAVFNHDRYAPPERDALSARVRSAARRLGLVTWEPDATIVRTSLLRAHPFDPTRPYGHWLRRRSSEGLRGVVFGEPIAVQAAPSDAPVFWPTRTRRQRGVVADLADGMTSGSVRARALAGAVLLRELFAVPMLAWLVAIVLVGRSGDFPLRIAPVAFFAVQGALSGARWLSSRMAYGVGVHPIEEARAAAYDLPGSLLAVPSALTRTVRRTRLTLPDQPLLWAALGLTLLTTAPLIDRRAETNGAIGVSVGLALGALVASWVFAMRAFGARGWDRASYRLPFDRPAPVDDHPARTVDASPSGLALTGVPATLAPGDGVGVAIEFDDERVLLRGKVTDRRSSGLQTSVGVALDLSAEEHARWVRRLFSAAGLTGRVPTFPETRGPRKHLAFEQDRAPVRRALSTIVPAVLVVALSTLVASALLLALLGYRPMVERSGSMVPKLRVGDVVVAEWVHADRIKPGEIVTFPFTFERTELVTHRVVSVHRVGDTLKVVTKGDANLGPELWSTPRTALVGRVVWKVPRVGAIVTLLGATIVRGFLLAASVLIILACVLFALARRRAVEPVAA